jgi:Histidine kinase-, DNA gyrase B-, and HSP90-like ATPase
VEVPEAEATVVAAPAESIDRLVGVLLDNACRHAPAGGAVVVAVAVERDRVRLSVRDSGPGIRDEERTRIFGRFHRSTEGGGVAGLGLAIGDAIVRQTSGHWQVGGRRRAGPASRCCGRVACGERQADAAPSRRHAPAQTGGEALVGCPASPRHEPLPGTAAVGDMAARRDPGTVPGAAGRAGRGEERGRQAAGADCPAS